MRIRVLGKSPSWQDAGGACSGYLVEAGPATLLIDCGNGVFGKLRQHADYLDVDAVVISHVHADHVLDLVPFAYALSFSPRRRPGSRPPALHLPPKGAERMRRLVGAWGNEDLIDESFDVREYGSGDAIPIGRLTITPSPVPHFTETFALTVADGEARFTFGADCAPGEPLIEAARGSRLLFAEATLVSADSEEPRGHMTPAEAGEMAAAAAVEHLVLTHISDEVDLEAAAAAAAAGFDGRVEVAAEGAVYEL